jgi:hypothetical protein
MKKPRSKYDTNNLVQMFRKAAAFRNEMLASGFTDNGGAIHSAERILDILGQRLKYPNLGHANNLRHDPNAEFSPAALEAYQRGEKVLIEHVSPVRDFTRSAIAKLDDGATDKQFLDYVRKKYRLVLLTPEETKHLNDINRSKMMPDRLGKASIRIVCAQSKS